MQGQLDLRELTPERAAEVRRLAESPDHRGCATLQTFADAIELSRATLQAFCTEDGQERQGLSERERTQGLVTFCRSMLADLHLPVPVGINYLNQHDACFAALVTAIRETADTGAPVDSPTTMLAQLAAASVFVLQDPMGSRYTGSSAPATGLQKALFNSKKLVEGWDAAAGGLAAQLEALQLAGGFEPVLTAQQARLLCLQIARHSCLYLGHAADGLGLFLPLAGFWQTGKDMCSRLQALDPGSAAYACQEAFVDRMFFKIDPFTALPMRTALHAAEGGNDHWWASLAAMGLLQVQLGGCDLGCQGPISVGEVGATLAKAERHAQLCKPWLPDGFSAETAGLAEVRAAFEQVVAAHPGQAFVPPPLMRRPPQLSWGPEEGTAEEEGEEKEDAGQSAAEGTEGAEQGEEGEGMSEEEEASEEEEVDSGSGMLTMLQVAARARRLVAESPEHLGSSEMLLFAESIEFAGVATRIFCTRDGRLRQGLSERQKKQGLVAFCRSLLADLQLDSPFLNCKEPCISAMGEAANDLLASQPAGATSAKSPAALLSQLATVGLILLRNPNGNGYTGKGPTTQLQKALQRGRMLADSWDSGRPSAASLAAQLEAEQRAAGFEPLLAAGQARMLCLLMARHAAYYLGMTALKQELPSAQFWEAESAMAGCLQALEPGSMAFEAHRAMAAMYNNSSGSLTARSAQLVRQALERAEAGNDHWTAFMLALCAAEHLLYGCESDVICVEEWGAVLDRAERHAELCEPWLPASFNAQRHGLRGRREVFDHALALAPGAQFLTAFLKPELLAAMEAGASPGPQAGPEAAPAPAPAPQAGGSGKRCAACGRADAKLRLCSACRRVSFCSVECQRRHWREGHKAECARLAETARRGD